MSGLRASRVGGDDVWAQRQRALQIPPQIQIAVLYSILLTELSTPQQETLLAAKTKDEP
jgi:hypothetical protein